MPIEVKITGNTGPEAVQELFSFLGTLQMNLMAGAQAAATAVEQKTAPANTNTPEIAKPEEPKKPDAEKKAKKAKEPAKEEAKTDAAVSTFTLQQAIDRAKEIAGDGKDDETMKKLKAINTGFGVDRVRELEGKDLDAYMAKVDEVFPPKATGSMFD